MRIVCLCLVLQLVPSIAFSDEPIVPIVAPEGLQQAKVSLGKKLFFETRLSADGSISCASCHDLDFGGVDNNIASIGIDGKKGSMNAPTVFNSALNFRQFWNGRVKTLEEQVPFPLQDKLEMGNTWNNVLRFLQQDEDYNVSFERIYDDGVTQDNVTNAIAEFERSLTLVDSRFDLYLKGDASAISADEKKGYQLFKDYGCVACHQGAALGGNMFQKFGVLENYFVDRDRAIQTVDLGRFNQTNNEEDKYVFKVPSLRMVMQTAPYFHDGSEQSLDEVIKIMAKYQLGREIPDADIRFIKRFFNTLAGVYQGQAW
ncbi:cytochrome-c peroxidase [Ghiorsea bivora]|uniref:cytochrome-c peroxidase n=1 Tax=Ghiorsea bivora TaxID=1485545 RepID=UPI000AB5EC8F|nr:cytochrome-c peroxidase [Ghiorsea bivora]